ncbi:MAG: hypothetical protein BZY84_08510 [SAR202 cluster bacterium MP-SInd-SRR3963457-G1]|nr:MAG: hypothetical protein BZY84_08510 [SAR202 cluster bacterium MP-SInd-SRR3963457-G1]
MVVSVGVTAAVAAAAGTGTGTRVAVGITGGGVLVAVFPQAAVTATNPAAIAKIRKRVLTNGLAGWRRSRFFPRFSSDFVPGIGQIMGPGSPTAIVSQRHGIHKQKPLASDFPGGGMASDLVALCAFVDEYACLG